MQELTCLLISPPNFYEDDENIWEQINSNFPPLGLASIAGYVRSKNHTVKIIDCNIESPSVKSFKTFFEIEIVKKISFIKIIGLTAMTCTIKKAYYIAEICKHYYPDSVIVFGGVHPTFVTEEVINNKFVDIVVTGEGELTFEEILCGKDLDKIKGIVFKKNKDDTYEVVRNESRERITDLDSLPIPAYDLLPVLKYRPAKGSYKRLPAMSMMTSRGCPGRCTFCSKTLGNKLVYRSAYKIFEEIKYLIDNYRIKQILFYDDTFTVNRDNVFKLCDILIDNRIDISWTCFARVDFIDLEMLIKMKKAGCHQIMYGVQNIDEGVLKNINKKIDINKVINATNLTKKVGIECRLAFMIGNPGDNEEIIKKNIAFINKVDPDLLIVNVTTPFPGTEMFKWAKEKNLILTYDWDDYNLANPVMRLENLTADQIKRFYKMMYRAFYFRLGFMLRKILKIRTIDDIKILFSGFISLLSFFKIKRG